MIPGRDLLAKRGRWLVVAAFLAVAVPVTFFSTSSFAAAADESNYHLPTVLGFAEELPRPDLSDYGSATTPLYHLVLAVVARATGRRLWVLRGVNLAIGLLCVLVAHRWLSRDRDPAPAVVGALILAFSPFVFGPATRLMTDNASLLLVLLTLESLRDHGPPGRSTLWASAAVGVRQTNLWLALLAGVSLVVDRSRGVGSTAMRWLPVVVPTVVVGFFVALWGGLVPPSSAGMNPAAGHGWVNPDALVFSVALVGAYGVFLPTLLREVGGDRPWRAGHAVAVTAVAGLVLAAVGYSPEQEYSPGPLDQIAGMLPGVAGQPLVLVVAFPLGLWILTLIARRARRSGEWLLPAAYLCWLGPVLVVPTFYQRHVGPFTLFFLLAHGLPTSWERSRDLVGPMALLVALVAIAVARHGFGLLG